MSEDDIAQARRLQLLEAGARVIAERGFANTRLADVAAVVGVSAPLLVHYFGTREQLLSEALQYTDDRFFDLVSTRLATIPRPADQLSELIAVNLCPGPTAELPPGWVLWFEIWNRAVRDPAAAAKRSELDARWAKTVTGIIRRGQASGDFRQDVDAQRAARMLSALLDGLSIQVQLGDPTLTPDEALGVAYEARDRLLGV